MEYCTNRSIAVLICYMGPLPWYFAYFLHSCAHNGSVKFFIIGDNDFQGPLPANVSRVKINLSELNSLASTKLGFETRILNPYKLCDFKPAYGLIFDHLIKGFDFWAFADIDVIFGSIRDFVTEDILNANDLINFRHDYLTGQFLLFRNCEKMINLFALSKDYKRILQSEEHYCFDETNFEWNGFSDGLHYLSIHSEIESMTHLVKRLQEAAFINAYFDFHVIEGTPGRIRWKEGKLYYKGKYETILYHLVLFKKIYSPPKLPRRIQEDFRISSTRIY